MSVNKVYARAIEAGRFKEKDVPVKRKAGIEKELKTFKEKKGGDRIAENKKQRIQS